MPNYVVPMVSDALLALVCAALAIALHREQEEQQVREWWSTGFAALAAAAFFGGPWHGLAPYVGAALLVAADRLAVYGVGLFDLAILTGSIIAVTEGRLRHTLIMLAALKFFVFAMWMLSNHDIAFVIADAAGAVFALALLHGWAALTRGDRGSLRILAALALALPAAAIQIARIPLHPLYGNGALFNIVAAGAILLLYNGGRILRDRPSEAFA
jgi:hypothetical protein